MLFVPRSLAVLRTFSAQSSDIADTNVVVSHERARAKTAVDAVLRNPDPYSGAPLLNERKGTYRTIRAEEIYISTCRIA